MDGRTAWELSLCCLENARDILLALETEFRSLYQRMRLPSWSISSTRMTGRAKAVPSR